jgi:hypothetical protein
MPWEPSDWDKPGYNVKVRVHAAASGRGQPYGSRRLTDNPRAPSARRGVNTPALHT